MENRATTAADMDLGSRRPESAHSHENRNGENQPPNALSARDKQIQNRARENAEDLILFQAFLAGKKEGYTQLYLKYRQRVYAYCLRMLCDDDEAQDLFQEVFVRVYERAAQFEEARSVSGWIFTIAHNLCLNKIRDRKPSDSIDNVELSYNPSDSIGDNWTARIQWAINQIPVDQREAFVLREYEGLSYQEIADILHTTLPAIKSRIYRAKEGLRQLLEPYYYDDVP